MLELLRYALCKEVRTIIEEECAALQFKVSLASNLKPMVFLI